MFIEIIAAKCVHTALFSLDFFVGRVSYPAIAPHPLLRLFISDKSPDKREIA